MIRYELSASDRFHCAFYRSGAGFGFCFGMTCLLPAASSAPFTEVGQVLASASVYLACFQPLPLRLLPKWSRFWLLLRYDLPASGRFLCAFYRSRAGFGFCFGMPCLLPDTSAAPFTEVRQVLASAPVYLACFRPLPLRFYRSRAGFDFCFGNSSTAGIDFSSSGKQCLTIHYQNGMIKLIIYKNYPRRPHGKNPHPLPAHRAQHKQALPQRTLGPVHDGHHQVRAHPAGR